MGLSPILMPGPLISSATSPLANARPPEPTSAITGQQLPKVPPINRPEEIHNRTDENSFICRQSFARLEFGRHFPVTARDKFVVLPANSGILPGHEYSKGI